MRRKPTYYTLYNIFPPIGLFTFLKLLVAPTLYFGGFAGLISLLASFIFAFMVGLLIDSIIFLVILLIILVLSGNKSLVSLKRVITSSFVISLIAMIAALVAGGIFERSELESNTPLSYYLTLGQSLLLAITVQFFISGIITFILFYLFFRKLQLKRLLVVCFFVAFINLPWSLLMQTQDPPQLRYQYEVKNISPQEVESLSKQIKVKILGEEIIPDPKSSEWKQLRLNASINVPRTGQYQIKFIFTTPDKFNDSFAYIKYSPDLYYFNYPEPTKDNVKLTEGENKLTFDFPYINFHTNTVNLRFNGDVATGQYGPYIFQFEIYELIIFAKNTVPLTIPLKYKSEQYTTKSYKYTDFAI